MRILQGKRDKRDIEYLEICLLLEIRSFTGIIAQDRLREV